MRVLQLGSAAATCAGIAHASGKGTALVGAGRGRPVERGFGGGSALVRIDPRVRTVEFILSASAGLSGDELHVPWPWRRLRPRRPAAHAARQDGGPRPPDGAVAAAAGRACPPLSPLCCFTGSPPHSPVSASCHSPAFCGSRRAPVCATPQEACSSAALHRHAHLPAATTRFRPRRAPSLWQPCALLARACPVNSGCVWHSPPHCQPRADSSNAAALSPRAPRTGVGAYLHHFEEPGEGHDGAVATPTQQPQPQPSLSKARAIPRRQTLRSSTIPSSAP